VTVTEILHDLLHLLLPAPCLGCYRPLPPEAGAGAGATLGLCPDCRGDLCPVPEPACSTCGRPLAGALVEGFRCGRCRTDPPAFSHLRAAWLYRPPLDAVILGLKFRRLDYLGLHLGRHLATRFAGELTGFDAAVPIALTWRRTLTRGYNQAALIARPLAEALGIPVLHALRRRRTTIPQARLSRPRRLLNPRGTFAVRRGIPVAGARLLLVDDVATTGATLSAAAHTLRQAGATEVAAVVVARTPETGASKEGRGHRRPRNRTGFHGQEPASEGTRSGTAFEQQEKYALDRFDTSTRSAYTVGL